MTISFEEFATYREIKSQTEAWTQALDVTRTIQLPKAENYDQVIFTGCGSTYYLSLASAALYQELTGRVARAIPGSELLLNSKTILANQEHLLVAISRSGTTTETVKAVEKFKAEKRGDVLVISNYEEVLSRQADVNIVISKGQEESVAQTRSFASMYVAAAGCSARMAGRNDLLDYMSSLPETGERLIRDFEPAARQTGENLELDRFYFLGSGIRYGLACEVNLKMKEMTLTQSEPFHFLEFRHGPMSMVNNKTIVVGLVSESNFSHETAVLNEMHALGGKTLSLGESGTDIPFNSGIPESVRGVLYLPVLQLMAFYRSLAKGLNPDRPTNLVAVIKLDL
jgi:glucosamine--fructose-6-phosphate aminotransferase (isomerizing)